MDTLTTIGLLAVTAIVTLARASKLRSTTRSTRLWLLGVTLTGAALAWPLSAYLEWAMANPFTVAVAVAIGIGIGYVWPEHLFGFAIGFVVNGAAAAPSLTWMASVIAGYAVLRLQFTRSIRDLRTNWGLRRALRDLGAQRRGFDWDGALWWLAAAMAVVPLLLGVITFGVVVAAAGVLVSAAVLARVLDLRHLTKRFRRKHVAYVAGQVPAVALLAAGPLGALHGPIPWVRVVVSTAVFGAGVWLAGTGRPQGRLLRSARLRLVAALSGLFGTFLGEGLFPFFVAVFHPKPWLLAGAAALAVVGLALRVRGGNSMLTQNVTAIVSRFDAESEIAQWARDAVHRRPHRPDVKLLVLLINQAMSAPHRVPFTYELYGHFGGYTPALGSETSLEWLQLAEKAIDKLEEAAPHHLRRELLALRANCATARANLHGYLSQREEGAAAYRRAMWLFGEADMPNGQAMARIGLGIVLGVRLRQRAAAMAELVPLFDDEQLSPAARRWAVLTAMLVARTFDDEDEVRALRARRDVIVATKFDYQALFRETSPWDSRRVNRATVRVSMRMFEEEELLFDLHSPTGTEHLPVGRGILRVPERELLDAGKLLMSQGKTRRALVVLEEAAQLAETQEHPQFVLMARSAIAEVHVRQGDRVAAWRNLATAIDAHQRIRGLVLEQEARSEVGGLWADLFDQGVAILGAEPITPAPTGWPARPHATAFELGELARSRALLELLGSRLDPVAAQGISADDERAALEWLHEARVQLDAAAPGDREEAQLALRQAATALDRLYDGWAQQGGQAAEYVALRRGQPATYAEIRRLLAE